MLGTELISRVTGYSLTGGNFSNTTPNLPQRVAILAEPNTANIATAPTIPTAITSAKQAGEIYGYGSPIHSIMRILRPVNSDGLGGIPTVVYPQLETTGTANVITVAATGTATANTKHTVIICGRSGLDGSSYDFNVTIGDDSAGIAANINDAVSAVLGCPASVSVVSDNAVLTSKWKGATSASINVYIETYGIDAGLTYTTTHTTTGAGAKNVAPALASFSDTWNTIVVNSYGLNDTVCTALEEFNGKPDPINPTGRYSPTIMKPFIALSGTVNDEDNDFLDDRKDELTIVSCPAPMSLGMQYEAAANYCLLEAIVAQNTPELDIAGNRLFDMPTPSDIGDMANYVSRQSFLLYGSSTVSLRDGRYQIEDFVTTYHPTGESPAQFRYPRNLILDFNVYFGYHLLEQIHVIDHVIVGNNDFVEAEKVVSPKQWIAVLNTYADDLTRRGLVADPSFMKSSLVVGIDGVNPDRLNTSFRYKRTGTARVLSTVAEAGFNN